MRKICSNLVWPVHDDPVKNGIIVLNDENQIVKLIHPENGLKEQAGLEYYSGVLIPGLISDTGIADYHKTFETFKNHLIRTNKSFQMTLNEHTLEMAIKFGIENKKGSIEPGKTPGILRIYPFDYNLMTLLPGSKLYVLVQ